MHVIGGETQIYI